jgi:hypothetical protein
MTCPYYGNDLNLKTACGCLEQVASLANALDKYEKDYENYSKDMAEYNLNYQKWQNRYDRWSSDKASQEKQLADERIHAGCGACGTNKGCPGGYDWKNRVGCWGGGFCDNICGRNKDQINIDLQSWLIVNPEPSPPLKPTFEKKPPSGNNIVCCSQLFSNINAKDVNFSNISQQCALKVQQDINDSLKGGGGGGGGGSGGGTSSSSTNNNDSISNKQTEREIEREREREREREKRILTIWILIVLSICLFSFLISFGGYYFYSQQ